MARSCKPGSHRAAVPRDVPAQSCRGARHDSRRRPDHHERDARQRGGAQCQRVGRSSPDPANKRCLSCAQASVGIVPRSRVLAVNSTPVADLNAFYTAVAQTGGTPARFDLSMPQTQSLGRCAPPPASLPSHREDINSSWVAARLQAQHRARPPRLPPKQRPACVLSATPRAFPTSR